MRSLLILIPALLILATTLVARGKDPFEGTTWQVTVTPDEDAHGVGERDFADTLTFKGSKFLSEKFKSRGFDAVDVDTDVRQGGIGGFTANTKSEKNGTAKWTGTATGAEISGDLVWTKADGSVLNYKYTGEKKQ